MGVESKQEKISPTLAVSAGGEESTAEDAGLLKLKAILMGSNAKKKKEKQKEPFVTDRGGKKAPLLTTNPSERVMRGQRKQPGKHTGPQVSPISDVNPMTAKPYPGPNNLLGLKALAWNSTVVYSILTYRRHQLTKKNPVLVPKGKEPPFKLSILDYTANEVVYLPYLDDAERHALVKIYMKLDPLNVYTRKGKVFRDKKDDLLTRGEIELVRMFEKKHWDFYENRRNDSRAILKFLHDPDPYYSEESNWQYLLTMILEDLLIIDRGVLVKTRDEEGRLIALTPVDGATIRPIVGPDGYITQYAQVVDGREFVNIYDKKDLVLFRMNLTPDIYRYGYGMPNMEVLSRTVMSDIFIDKGNLDYYRKGGSVPEGFLVVEPPGNTDEGYVQLDKETLDGIQRQLQAIIMSDFTQVPLVSGGKFSWIALKGTRKDMQFKELAEYLTRKICAVFQVSPQDVGVIADVNRSTAEAQMSLTRAKGLETLAATISNYFTRGVIDELRPQRDIKLWWDEDDAKIAQERWTVEMQQLNTGVKTINEVRAERGEDPVPWGDTPFQGLKNWISEEEMMEMQQQGKMPGAPIPGGAPGAGGMPLPLAGGAGKNPGPQAVGPVPSGQMPGQSLGTPANPANAMKSIDEILAEVKKWEETQDIDPEPLVKTFMPAAIDGEEQLERAESVVVDMLDVADSVLESVIKRVKIDGTTIYFQVSGWLDRNVISKLIFQLFDMTPESSMEIKSVTSNSAVVDIMEAGPYHYEAFVSPQFRLLAQLMSLVYVKAPIYWKLNFLTSESEFEAIKTGVLVDADKSLKVITDYAATLYDYELSPVVYPAIIRGTGIEEDIAKNIKYSTPANLMSYLYSWKVDYGFALGKPTIDAISAKLEASGENDSKFKYIAEFFKKLHTLPETSRLPDTDTLCTYFTTNAVPDIWAYVPGSRYTTFAEIKKDLTKDDRTWATYSIALSMLSDAASAQELVLQFKDNKEIREAFITLLQLETPWKIGRKKAEKIFMEVLDFWEAADDMLRTTLCNPSLSFEASCEDRLISPAYVNVINSDSTSPLFSSVFEVYNDLVKSLVNGKVVVPEPLHALQTELRRALVEVNLLSKQYETALEEASALVSEGLGVDKVRLELLDESAETLVELTNNLSTGNKEVDAQVIPVVRSILLGEDVDELQKSIAAALLQEDTSESG